MFKKVIHVIAKVIGGIVFGVLAAFLFGWLVMLLWNWLMPSLFGLPVVGFWKAWGLIILAHILFKSGCHGPGHLWHRHHHGEWKGRFKEKVEGHFRERGPHPEETVSD
jgi:hypothetical protein